MTETETLLLIVGIGIGAQGMAIWQAALDMRDAHRNLARSRAARRRAAADHYLNSLTLYQLQQRTETRG
ncbi:hypothetical protein AB0L04_22555 [Streptomyces glaucescens]|uniref:hypothetical protein n=1 Tax=Streptomyces glaucescens TaxID=1907 RepID=UPI00344D2800